MSGPISASGDKIAKAEAEKHTTIALEGSKAEGGQPAEATISVDTEHDSGRVTWGIGAWFKRKFQRGGSSAGVKGKIEF